MIYEGVIITSNADGSPHITPMGFRRRHDAIEVAPFVPSRTLDNLLHHPEAVMNLTDDVRIIAGALTGRVDWPVTATEHVRGWRLLASQTHLELEVRQCRPPAERPVFDLGIVHEAPHLPFRGFNRAQAAVVEAAILISRLDFIDAGKLAGEMAYLHIAVSKTAGPAERTAWHWLLDAIAGHPRHPAVIDGLYLDRA